MDRLVPSDGREAVRHASRYRHGLKSCSFHLVPATFLIFLFLRLSPSRPADVFAVPTAAAAATRAALHPRSACTISAVKADSPHRTSRPAKGIREGEDETAHKLHWSRQEVRVHVYLCTRMRIYSLQLMNTLYVDVCMYIDTCTSRFVCTAELLTIRKF